MAGFNQKKRVELLNPDRRLIQILDNASNINLNESLNNPGECSLSFQLPYNDPKLKDCQAFCYIRLVDETGAEKFDLYRIMPRSIEHHEGGLASIECEHVIATLADDILFGYHEIGGSGISTVDILNYILDQQTVKRWVLGRCDFGHQFQYGWEHESLLKALFSIPERFSDDYIFTYDTSVFPWTVNLIKLDRYAKPKSYFRYEKNVQRISKTEDASEICTKLYCLGYGEGINQLSIASENNGLPYLLAEQKYIDQYGLISRTWVDRSFEYADSLKARGQKLLESYQKPRISYSLDIVDLFPISNNPLDQPRIGDMTRVIDNEIGEDYSSLIVSIKRSDLFGTHPSVQIDVENSPPDLASSISEQADRLHVEQTYAQGATNIWSLPFAENADPGHPIVVELFIPEGTRIVNRVNLRWRAEAFRADVRGMASGGGTYTATSTQPAQTSSSGGGTYSSTGGGGGTYSSTDTGGQQSTTAGPSNKNSSDSFDGVTEVGWTEWTTLTYTSGNTQRHRHEYDSTSPHTHGIQHTHNFTLPGHSHSFQLGDHNHSFSVSDHSHTIPQHSHTVNIAAHSHAQEYGIYEGPQASAVTITIGGKSFSAPQNTDVDIVQYLEKDEQGLIKRGTSHIITITPNALTRLAGTITPQVFIQSRGGGNY